MVEHWDEIRILCLEFKLAFLQVVDAPHIRVFHLLRLLFKLLQPMDSTFLCFLKVSPVILFGLEHLSLLSLKLVSDCNCQLKCIFNLFGRKIVDFTADVTHHLRGSYVSNWDQPCRGIIP